MRAGHLGLTLAACVSIVGCGGAATNGTGTGGANSGTGGGSSTGGSTSSGGAVGSGGVSASGGSTASGGKTGSGGAATAGMGGTKNDHGGAASGGTIGGGGKDAVGGSALGGRASGGAGGAAGGRSGTGGQGSGGTGSGTCVASKAAGSNASGSGPHKVTVETNSDSGINEGTIFRPTDLGGTEKYPIFVWGEGACSQDGLSNAAAMGEIASHGYFVIADGKPNGSGSRTMTAGDVVSMGKPLLRYVDWAIAENGKSCSAYYQALDTTKVAANGFSCGGLMSEGTAPDPRITTWGLNSSGLISTNAGFYKMIHTPVLIVLGGSGDIAYQNGENDYTAISAMGIPIMLFSKALGHGGDLFSTRGGDFAKIDLAWLNWQLKGDVTATGKGLLVGAGCSYCTNSAWEVKSMNIP